MNIYEINIILYTKQNSVIFLKNFFYVFSTIGKIEKSTSLLKYTIFCVKFPVPIHRKKTFRILLYSWLHSLF